MPKKRTVVQVPLVDERPAKRFESLVESDCESTSSTEEGLIATTCSTPWLPLNSDKVTLASLSDLDTDVSWTPSPTTPAPAHDVCFGTLYGVKTQFLGDPCVASIAARNEGAPSNHYLLHIVMKRIYVVQAQDGTEIAIINSQTAGALQQLDNGNFSRCSAYVSTSEWTEKIRSFRTMGKSVLLEVDVYFFGDPAHGITVGKILSNSGLFLQIPDLLDSSVKYDNPQEAKFASTTNPSRSSNIEASALGIMSDLSPNVVSTMLGHLDHADELTVVDVDTNVIVTELKPYQKEAIDFICRRESPSVPQAFSILKHRVDAENRSYCENTIIGRIRTDVPNESFGGIIADEMGLGKTLMTISAICMSLGRARQFANVGSHHGVSIRTKATLVICPAVLLMDTWAVEIVKHTAPGMLKWARYHGTRKAVATELFESDIVLTTYATLMADSNRSGILHSLQWFRIVLDEAHSIRHQNTKQFQAVLALSANHRWCLTGTPIQNSIDDLGALVRFLRVPDMEQPSSFRTHISGPIEDRAAAGVRRLRALLQYICLRRTKDLLSDLGEPDERVEAVALTDGERAEYDHIGREYKRAFDEALCGSDPTAAHRVFFTAIMRQRIFCNAGLLATAAGRGTHSTEDEELSLLEQGDGAICAHCCCDVRSIGVNEKSLDAGVFLECAHLLCHGCISERKKHSTAEDLVNCPTCRAFRRPHQAQRQESHLDVVPTGLEGHSSKLEAVVNDILLHRTEKCIVFSSWKKSIQLAAAHLTARGIPNVVVDGSVSVAERRLRLRSFQDDSGIPALLMTLGTGAVGLTLTAASRIHILEPQWNPSVEKQAIGRAIRLGQQRKVTVVRYVVQDTVEQYIQTRQRKKMYLAQLGWSSSMDGLEDGKRGLLQNMIN